MPCMQFARLRPLGLIILSVAHAAAEVPTSAAPVEQMLSVQCRPGQDVVGPNSNVGINGAWASSDQECDQRCLNTTGCTAWIRPRFAPWGECWMVSGAVSWRDSSDRNAGTPGCTEATNSSYVAVAVPNSGSDEETPLPTSDNGTEEATNSGEDTPLPTSDNGTEETTNSSYVDVSIPNSGSDEDTPLPTSDDVGVVAGMPPFRPLRGIAYGALPCREHACQDAGQVSEDMLQASYMGQWGASGRDDLGTIARLGGNAVRLYHSLGLRVDADHCGFLDRSAEVGVNVLAGYHTYNACPDFDCFESWKQATLHGFQHGFRQGDDWHPAVAALILLNEPDLVHPGSRAVGRIKLVLSALDGVLAAEKEAGVMAGRTRFTVTWSFAMHDALDGSFTGVTHWGFQDTKTGMFNPAAAGYNPRCSQAELMHAFETRWVHGLNTQAPWDFVNAMISGEEPNFAPTPWFVGEYGANGQLAETIQLDLENIAQKAEEDEMFLGAAFFQFQTAHFKGGSETNFGLFRLGEQTLSESSGLPVYCLSTHLPWLPGTMGDRASAVAAAWHGSLEGIGGLCAGGRRLDIETESAIHV